jgi:hypothetical protein
MPFFIVTTMKTSTLTTADNVFLEEFNLLGCKAVQATES